jgi:uridine kinase
MPPVLVGITGGSASGKSRIARALVESLSHHDCAVINQDNFFRDWTGREELRTANRPDSVLWPAFADAMDAIAAGRGATLPAPGTRSAARGMEQWTVAPRDLLVVEGLFALWDDELRARYDLTVYVDAADDERALRRMNRDVAERGANLAGGTEWYRHDVLNSFPRYTAPFRLLADIVIPNASVANEPRGVRALVAAVQGLLAARSISS